MINLVNAPKLNKSQKRALDNLLYYAAREEYAGTDPATVVVYTIEFRDKGPRGFWVNVKKDIPSLGENNVLRSMYRMESWFVYVGKRGRTEIHIGPKSLAQFKGKDYCGMHVRKDLSTTGL